MSHWHGKGVTSICMLVWPEEEYHMREVRLRQEARDRRRARQIAAKQAVLCKAQWQRQTIDYLQQKLRDWEDWFLFHEKPRTRTWLTVGQHAE
eukprot:4253338-Alexandrium_andersonii.AAC.1